MIGFRKYVGLSALLVFGVGYHAVSTREQCDLKMLQLNAYQLCSELLHAALLPRICKGQSIN